MEEQGVDEDSGGQVQPRQKRWGPGAPVGEKERRPLELNLQKSSKPQGNAHGEAGSRVVLKSARFPRRVPGQKGAEAQTREKKPRWAA